VSLYALNLFDLAGNDDYRAYSRRSAAAVGKHGGRVVALGRLDDPDHESLHPLRDRGTRNYVWWAYERLEDLRPLFTSGAASGT
jgi:uncharacterized protein (DUF1330 family)